MSEIETESSRKYFSLQVMPVTHFLVKATRCIAKLLIRFWVKFNVFVVTIPCSRRNMGSNKEARRRNVKSSRIAPDLPGTKLEKKHKSKQQVSKPMLIAVVLVVVFLTGAYYR